jgi:serine/threonine-protein kinase
VRKGDILDDTYVLRRPLGEGGMGRTFLAEDVRSAQPETWVVVKTLKEEQLQTITDEARTRALGRFRRESLMLRGIHHGNIPNVFAVNEFRGLPYFVMQYINGTSLSDYLLNNHPPRREEAAALGIQVTRALSATHAAGVVHRDLTPGNIMITHRGWVYLIDFGIALPLDGDPTRYTGSFVGTPGYVAPERIAHPEKRALPPADLYSLGCVLYLMLARQLPFSEETNPTKDVGAQHLEDIPAPLPRDVPAPLNDLVLGLLAKCADDRPACDEVITTLADYAPRPGDHEPNPSFDPDLTLPFRFPGEVHPPEAGRLQRGPSTRRFDRGRSSGFISPDDVAQRIRQAEDLASTGDTSAAKGVLTALLAEAVPAFGKRHHIVLQVKSALIDLD